MDLWRSWCRQLDEVLFGATQAAADTPIAGRHFAEGGITQRIVALAYLRRISSLRDRRFDFHSQIIVFSFDFGQLRTQGNDLGIGGEAVEVNCGRTC